MGTRFLLTRESTVPDAVKKIYLETQVTGTVVTKSIDGYPQRVIRTKLVDALERSSGRRGRLAPRRSATPGRSARLTGTSMTALLREGFAMKKAQELTSARWRWRRTRRC